MTNKELETKELKDAIEYEEDAETKALLQEEYYGIVDEAEIAEMYDMALRGEKYNGHNFIFEAFKRGAKAIIIDDKSFIDKNLPIIEVDNTREVLSKISSQFFNNPSKTMNIIGVTGTNGKTTITQIIRSLLNSLGDRCGSIGTLGFIMDDTVVDTKLTTPESLELHGMLKVLLDNKISYSILEVSSHSLVQHRVDHVDFDVAIFTNLTHDHLDYHKTMNNYFQAKSKLFLELKNKSSSIINTDDSFGKKIFNSIDSNKISYGFNKNANISILEISSSLDKSEVLIKIFQEKFKIKTNLIGKYNILNII